MKKILALICIAFLASCSVNTSKIDGGNIDPNDITYFKDSRTGLCFAIMASRKTGDASSTGLGMTCVPCEALEHVNVIKK